MKSLKLKGTAQQLDAIQHAKDRNEITADQRLRLLFGARPEQIGQWVDNNVRNLGEAQAAIKLILQALVVIGRREFTE